MLNDSTRAFRLRRRAWPPAALTAAAIITAAGLALLAAACGGSPGSHVAQLGSTTTPSSSPSGGPSSSGSTLDQALAYANCLRTHGLPRWPDPESSGRFDKSKLTPHQLGASSSQVAAAEQACQTLLPTFSATRQQQVQVQALRFSRCMRDHGVTNFPDPDSNGGLRIPDSVENSPGFQAALNACEQKYGVPPAPNPAGGGGS